MTTQSQPETTEPQTAPGPAVRRTAAIPRNETREQRIQRHAEPLAKFLVAWQQAQDYAAREKGSDCPRGTWTPPDTSFEAFEAYVNGFEFTSKLGKRNLLAAVRERMGQTPGELAKSDAQRQRKSRADVEAAIRRSQLLVDSDLPPLLYEANFQTNAYGLPLQIGPGNARALKGCAAFVRVWEPGKRGFTLSGADNGCGKSYAAGAVLRGLMGRGFVCRFVSEKGFLSLCKASLNALSDTRVLNAAQVWERYAPVPVLLLDDLGAEKIDSTEAGDWSRGKLLDLIDHRLEHSLTTLLTTNLDADALSKKYGARMVSRLLARSPLITMTGPDFRQDCPPDADDPFAE